MAYEPLPFGSVALKKELVEFLKEDGMEKMSPIQSHAIPLLLKGKSVLGLSPTGTGKTLAYSLPILNDLEDKGKVQAVIISPTVALLSQVKEVLLSFTRRMNFPLDAVKAVFENADFTRSKPDILLVTPSMYAASLSHYPFDQLKRVIIDEGDMVAFDGFQDMLYVLKKQKERHQISFFSASLNTQDIKRVKTGFGIEEVIDDRDNITNNMVRHHLVDMKSLSLGTALKAFLENVHPMKTIAFASTKKSLYETAEELKKLKVPYLLLEGGMDKRDIVRTINEFKKMSSGLLLASDYASRGLDIQDVDAIVSLNLPAELDYYFHRAGRAGRFFTPGDSYVFFTYDDEEGMKSLKALLRREKNFDLYVLKEDGIKKSRDAYEFHNLGKKDRMGNEVLQKQIRHAVNETKSKKVKPGYKKKVKKAVERVKEKHRKKVVLTNIAKSGGNARDFHTDDKPRKRK